MSLGVENYAANLRFVKETRSQQRWFYFDFYLTMLKNLVITTIIEQWNDLLSLNHKFLNKFVFRGQSNSEWGLTTALERMVKQHTPNYVDNNLPAIYESNMLADFKWKYPLYEKTLIPRSDDNIEWLALMQHYGAPTRLLDFTRSLYVALYMALDNSFSDYSSIWAINSIFIREKAANLYLKEHGKTSGVVPHSELDVFIKKKVNSYINYYADNIENELYLITPSLCNERISIQQGLFIMPSNIKIPFGDSLNSVFSEAFPQVAEISFKNLLKYSNTDLGKAAQHVILLLKILIPKKFKLQLTKLLLQMNITAETLYPGLEGMAKSLSYLRHGMHEYEE